jgi:hypothetical protein
MVPYGDLDEDRHLRKDAAFEIQGPPPGGGGLKTVSCVHLQQLKLRDIGLLCHNSGQVPWR